VLGRRGRPFPRRGGEATHSRDEVSHADPQELSAEELFTGIFFGVGPAAHLAADVHAPADEGEVAEFVALLKEKEPGLLPQFKTDVTSGDAVRVERALGSAAESVTNLGSAAGDFSPRAGAALIFIFDRGGVFDQVLADQLFRDDLARNVSRSLAVEGVTGP
jgi:hypothetical protein